MSVLAWVKEYAQRLSPITSMRRPFKACDSTARFGEDEQDRFAAGDSVKVHVGSEFVGAAPFNFESYMSSLFSSDIGYSDWSPLNSSHGGENLHQPFSVGGTVDRSSLNDSVKATGPERDHGGYESGPDPRPNIHGQSLSGGAS